MAAPKVDKLAKIMATLDPAYKPQMNLLRQQQKLLPGQRTAAVQGLEQAKLNNFRDIRETAVGSGNIWSGAPIEEQQRYVGEKFLPAVADVESNIATQGFNLSQMLASLQGEQRTKALDYRTDQKKTLDAYLEAERDRQFRAQQAALDRAATLAKSSSEASKTVDISLKRNKNGGYTVLENGKPSKNYDLAQAADLMGKDLVSLLRNGDAQDRQAAQWYDEKLKNWGTSEENIAKFRMELMKDRPTAFFMGGSY